MAVAVEPVGLNISYEGGDEDDLNYVANEEVVEQGDFDSVDTSEEDEDEDNLPVGNTNLSGQPVFLENLEEFAFRFKSRRMDLGFSQADVGLAMGKLYKNDFSQTTVSRFEALNLSFKNMCKLKPLLEKWLCDTEAAMATGKYSRDTLRAKIIWDVENNGSLEKRRKKRTTIEGSHRQVLEEVFLTNPKPSLETMTELATTLNMDPEVVRVWFGNRRQKAKRLDPDVVFPDEPAGAAERFRAAATASGLRRHTVDSSSASASASAVSIKVKVIPPPRPLANKRKLLPPKLQPPALLRAPLRPPQHGPKLSELLPKPSEEPSRKKLPIVIGPSSQRVVVTTPLSAQGRPVNAVVVARLPNGSVLRVNGTLAIVPPPGLGQQPPRLARAPVTGSVVGRQCCSAQEDDDDLDDVLI